MATRMQQRRGTAAQWTAANPVLAAGEIGFETDTSKFKMGNGSSAWSALTYFANAAELAAIIDGAPDLLNTLNELAASIGDDADFVGTVTAHTSATTTVHGIADTAQLATLSGQTNAIVVAGDVLRGEISSHANNGLDVHGIENTANLVTLSGSQVLTNKTLTSPTINTPTGIVKADVGLSNADNTSDLDKPVSTAQAEAIENAATTAEENVTEALGVHTSKTLDVHGIPDTSLLVTQTDLTDAIGGATVDQSALAGVGIDWNTQDERFDIDSTVATKTYADESVSDHNALIENVHGIADTSELATKTYADGAATTAVEGLTKSSVGLGNVDNTSDANKPVSTATQTALDLKAPKADPTFTGTVSGVTKSHVGLGNVDNTSDADKPISDATQDALDLKADLAGAIFTGNVEVDGNLVVDGDFTVNGTNFNASATSIVIEDNLLQLSHLNPANTVDLGLVVAYNDGSGKHAGIVRDVSDAKWKLFKDVASEPTTVVAFGEGSLDALAVGALEATTVTPSSGVVFSDGTQTKLGVPSVTTFATAISSSATLAAGEEDKFVPLTGAVTITLPATGYSTGQSIDFYQESGTGAQFASTNSVVGTPGLKFRTTNSVVTAMKTPTGWLVFGDLSL
jgi:hypothetical protein